MPNAEILHNEVRSKTKTKHEDVKLSVASGTILFTGALHLTSNF